LNSVPFAGTTAEKRTIFDVYSVSRLSQTDYCAFIIPGTRKSNLFFSEYSFPHR
jgi:hypothetical protein